MFSFAFLIFKLHFLKYIIFCQIDRWIKKDCAISLQFIALIELFFICVFFYFVGKVLIYFFNFWDYLDRIIYEILV